MNDVWTQNERGAFARAGGVALLVNATWVSDDAWFYDCPMCECDFGPLVDQATARDDAIDHDFQWHNGQKGPQAPSFKVGDRVRPRPGATFSEPTTQRIQAADGVGVVYETDVEMWDMHLRFGDWTGGFWADDFELVSR